MAKALVLTHGGLAASLYETLGLFVGDREGLEAIGMDVDTQSFHDRVQAAILDSPETEILVMLDLFGGTPFNMVASLLAQAKAEGKRVELVTGVNLPMLLEVTPNIPHSSLEELKKMAFDIGKYGIRDLMAELEAKKEVN